MVRMLRGTSFALEVSSACNNLVLLLTKAEHCVFFGLLGIRRVVAWMTQQKGFHGDEKFNSSQLI